jgi:hypothetical protein
MVCIAGKYWFSGWHPICSLAGKCGFGRDRDRDVAFGVGCIFSDVIIYVTKSSPCACLHTVSLPQPAAAGVNLPLLELCFMTVEQTFTFWSEAISNDNRRSRTAGGFSSLFLKCRQASCVILVTGNSFWWNLCFAGGSSSQIILIKFNEHWRFQAFVLMLIHILFLMVPYTCLRYREGCCTR